MARFYISKLPFLTSPPPLPQPRTSSSASDLSQRDTSAYSVTVRDMASQDAEIEVKELQLSSTAKRKRGDSTTSVDGIPRVISRGIHSPSVASHDQESQGSAEEVDIDDLVDNLAVSTSDNDLLRATTPAEVRGRITDIGITQFVTELLEKTGKTPTTLGIKFGLDPEMVPDPEMYMYLLERILINSLTRRRKLPDYNTIDDAADLLRKSKNVMVITGAGISTSLGIPDFRSKNTGFYSKLQEIGFSEPEEVFDIHIFDDQPEIFYSLAGDILPKGKEYTPTHAFIRLLQDKEKLQTNYTQNIDNLEANAGIDPSKVIQCHGSFATASCRQCKHQVPGEQIFDDIRAKTVAYCNACAERIAAEARTGAAQKKRKRKTTFDLDQVESDGEDDTIPTAGVMKPDITFFGEQLPNTFFERFQELDSVSADLVIVIGTSLKVAPVADMPNHLPDHIPHIFISREPCQHVNFDIQLLGDCDAVCWELSRRAGWELKHDMVAEDFSVQVDIVEGSDHQWNITTAPRVT